MRLEKVAHLPDAIPVRAVALTDQQGVRSSQTMSPASVLPGAAPPRGWGFQGLLQNSRCWEASEIRLDFPGRMAISRSPWRGTHHGCKRRPASASGDGGR